MTSQRAVIQFMCLTRVIGHYKSRSYFEAYAAFFVATKKKTSLKIMRPIIKDEILKNYLGHEVIAEALQL